MTDLDTADLYARYGKDTTRINGQEARADVLALLSALATAEQQRDTANAALVEAERQRDEMRVERDRARTIAAALYDQNSVLWNAADPLTRRRADAEAEQAREGVPDPWAQVTQLRAALERARELNSQMARVAGDADELARTGMDLDDALDAALAATDPAAGR